MKTTRFEMNGKQKIVGVLRKAGTTPILDFGPSDVIRFNKQYGTDVKIIGAKTADHLLVKTDKWKDVTDAFPCPVGTAIAYEATGKKLDNEVIFAYRGNRRIILSTGKYKGEKDIALVAMDISAEDIQIDRADFRIVVPDKRLIVVPDFPSKDGWYMPHAETLVPHGKQVERSDEARRLWRIDNGSYVGLLVRDIDNSFYVRHDVNAFMRPDVRCGVAIEIPDTDMKKIGTPKNTD